MDLKMVKTQDLINELGERSLLMYVEENGIDNATSGQLYFHGRNLTHGVQKFYLTKRVGCTASLEVEYIVIPDKGEKNE